MIIGIELLFANLRGMSSTDLWKIHPTKIYEYLFNFVQIAVKVLNPRHNYAHSIFRFVLAGCYSQWY